MTPHTWKKRKFHKANVKLERIASLSRLCRKMEEHPRIHFSKTAPNFPDDNPPHDRAAIHRSCCCARVGGSGLGRSRIRRTRRRLGIPFSPRGGRGWVGGDITVTTRLAVADTRRPCFFFSPPRRRFPSNSFRRAFLPLPSPLLFRQIAIAAAPGIRARAKGIPTSGAQTDWQGRLTSFSPNHSNVHNFPGQLASANRRVTGNFRPLRLSHRRAARRLAEFHLGPSLER